MTLLSGSFMVVNIPVMKGVLFFFCLFILLFGILFVFSPKTVARMSQWGNRILIAPVDSVPRSHTVGALLLILGIVMAFVWFVI